MFFVVSVQTVRPDEIVLQALLPSSILINKNHKLFSFMTVTMQDYSSHKIMYRTTAGKGHLYRSAEINV